jgi:hypothetical protein
MNPIDASTYTDIEAYRNEVVKAISQTSPDFYRNFKVIALDNSKDVVCFAVEKTGTNVIDLVGSGTLETVISTCALFQDGIPSNDIVEAVTEEKVKVLATKLIKRLPLPDVEL